MRISTTLFISSLALCAATSSNAQIPVIGDLLNGASPESAIVGSLNLDQLSDSGNLLSALSPDELGGSLDGLIFAAQVVSPALQDIPKLVPTSLDISLVQGFVPSLEVLFTAPLSLPSYIFDGGTLVSPGLAYVPALPIISAPLAVDGADAFGNFLPTDDLLPVDLLQPDAALNLILGQLSAGSALLPPVALLL